MRDPDKERWRKIGTNKENGVRNQWIPIILLLILFVFIMMTISRNQIDQMTVSGSDGMTYYNAARNLRKYRLLTYDRDGSMFEGLTEATPTDLLAPGYPLFLVLLFSFFPESLTTVFASNVILGIVTILLLWKMLHTLHVSTWISCVITALYAIFPTTIDMTTTCLTENLFIPLFFGSLYCCICAYQRENLRFAAGGFLLLTLASIVRGQALLFLPLQFLFLFSKKQIRRLWLYILGVCLGILILVYVPLWVWLARQLGRFLVYPTDGSVRIWGAMPYFIDMPWSIPYSLTQIQKYNSTIAPGEYARWRSFGMICKMWFDCWSEDLSHSWYLTHWALWLHPFLVVPTLVLIPYFGRHYERHELFLASAPVLLTLACLDYHGIPRYVSASYPVLFALAGRNAQTIVTQGKQLVQRKKQGLPPEKKSVGKKKKAVMAIWGIFSLVLLYSLCIFPWQVDTEQSSYRLKKYGKVNLEDVRNGEIIETQDFDSGDITVLNAIQEEDGKYRLTWQDHAIIQLREINKVSAGTSDPIVTRVALQIDGGNLYDFSTIYWLTEDVPTWSEEHVYSIPRSSLSFLNANHPEVYIEGDVEALLIVPALFRGNEIMIHQITVEKIRVSGFRKNGS